MLKGFHTKNYLIPGVFTEFFMVHFSMETLIMWMSVAWSFEIFKKYSRPIIYLSLYLTKYIKKPF